MPDAREVQIRDAVIGELNHSSRPWYGDFLAEGAWDTGFTAGQLASLKVTVVPLTHRRTRLTRERRAHEYEVGIDFQKKVAKADNAGMDVLSRIAEQVQDFFDDGHRLAGLSGWQVTQADREDLFSPELLYSEHTWETLVVLTVRGDVS